MATYIISASLISPQETFEGNFPSTPIGSPCWHLDCHEPDYKQLLPPARLRRMSRILKMGLATSAQCIGQSAIKPDSIIVGTGQGCTIDLEKFMRACTEGKEELLSPIPFINSGHNTLAGQIAMFTQIKGYNMTYLQEDASLTSALTDATLLLEEGRSQCTLVGGIDEYSPFSFDVFNFMQELRKTETNNLELFEQKADGYLMGEGTAFFCLANQPAANAIELVTAESHPALTDESSCEWVEQTLKAHQLTTEDISTIIVGRNGDQRHDNSYYQPVENLFPEASIVVYKHLCGEYPTSDGFALWMAYTAKKEGQWPAYTLTKEGTKKGGATLIYNRSTRLESLMVVK